MTIFLNFFIRPYPFRLLGGKRISFLTFSFFQDFCSNFSREAQTVDSENVVLDDFTRPIVLKSQKGLYDNYGRKHYICDFWGFRTIGHVKSSQTTFLIKNVKICLYNHHHSSRLRPCQTRIKRQNVQKKFPTLISDIESIFWSFKTIGIRKII